MSDVHIVEYDPSWPERFAAEIDRLEPVLGGIVEEFHHIGSTAVPGLGAKPIVDVLAACTEFRRVEDRIEDVEALGYEFVPESRDADRSWRYFERRPEGWRNADGHDEQAYNLHCFPATSDEVVENLLFRNYLRERSDAAAEYESLKRELAAEHPGDLEAYSRGKTEFVESVRDRARERGLDPLGED